VSGLDANIRTDGYVTGCLYQWTSGGNCGSVGFLDRISHPISWPGGDGEDAHVMLVGSAPTVRRGDKAFRSKSSGFLHGARKLEEWLKSLNTSLSSILKITASK